jgi:outer membrane protein assembly factor BamB
MIPRRLEDRQGYLMHLNVTHLRGRPVGSTRRLLTVAATAGLILSGALSGASAGSAATGGSSNWTAYLRGAVHNSYAPSQRAITPGNAAKIVRRWHDFPKIAFDASPTVADNAVFIGSTKGWFYKLKATTGAILHKTFIGVQPTKTCGPMGVVSTATIANNPATHKATVYVEGPNGYLYALRASNLSVEWRSVIAIPSKKISNYFDWSSPTVTDDTIYVGVSSGCDNPLIRGGVIDFNQATGKKIAHFYTVPKGKIGGSVWSSVAVAPGGDVFASTGNGPEKSVTTQLVGDSDSILKLAPRTLKLLGRFQIPRSQVIRDADFGASPVIFGDDVGACDKNGYFYMLSQSTMQVLWQQRVGEAATGSDSCIAAPVMNAGMMYVGGVGWKIGGKTYRGSVQGREVASGDLVWQAGLGGGVLGSIALDGDEVITAPVFSNRAKTPSLYLIDDANGHVLKGLASGHEDFAQGVFAENMLFSANANGVYGWRPPS